MARRPCEVLRDKTKVKSYSTTHPTPEVLHNSQGSLLPLFQQHGLTPVNQKTQESQQSPFPGHSESAYVSPSTWRKAPRSTGLFHKQRPSRGAAVSSLAPTTTHSWLVRIRVLLPQLLASPDLLFPLSSRSLSHLWVGKVEALSSTLGASDQLA